MESFSDFLFLLTILIEVACLFYLEQKTWKTLYTPLNFLMLPYTAVLLITIPTAGNFGFVDFHYPSIIFWNIGLLLFALPSFVLGGLLNYYGKPIASPIEQRPLPRVLVVVATLVGLALAFQFYRTLGSSSAFVGSEDFAEEFSGHGMWAHIRQMSIPLLVICIYFLDKRHRWLWPIVIVLLLANFINQVKGAIIIAVLSGMALRLYGGKTKLSLKFILLTLGGAVALFFISYMVLPLLGKGEGEVTDELIEFVYTTFAHYFTSGVLGLSEDMVYNYPDAGSFDVIISPFINIYNQVAGDGEIISPVNALYYNTGHSLTNVRTFFGTLYIYSNWIQFSVYIVFLSTLLYMMKIFTIKYNNVFVLTAFFYECSLLAMGWFEFYFFHLAALEIPILSLILMALCSLRFKAKEDSGDNTSLPTTQNLQHD